MISDESPQHWKEKSFVRCLKCGTVLKCCRYDAAKLLEHIRFDHPEIYIVDTDTGQKRFTDLHMNRKRDSVNSEHETKIDENSGEENQKPRQPQYVKDIDLKKFSITSEILKKYPEIKECEYTPHNPNAQVLYTRRYRLNSPSTASRKALRQPFQYTLYRASIAKWRPANGCILCPKCGCKKRPLIKSKAVRFTYSEWAACCILSCWPFCFLPWIVPPQNNEYLFCAKCKTFLGLYDHKRNCIKPNRLYVDTCRHTSTKKAVSTDRNQDVDENKLLENQSSSPSPAFNSAKSPHLPSITIDGKELPTETVARLQNLKKYSSWLGVDMNALTNPADNPKSTKSHENQKENEIVATPSKIKQNENGGRHST